MTAGTSSNTPKSNTRTHLPSHKGKHAPRVFTGCFDKVAQFFEELEGTCDEHNVTDPKEKCEAVVRYSNKEVVKDIKGLQEYHDRDYEALKHEMFFIYDGERDEDCYSSKDLFKLIRKWKAIKIKDLPTFKKFYWAYQRIAGWLHIQKKISDNDFKLWFWAGLHQAFQRKVEARMRIDDRHLDDTKAFEILKIVEAVLYSKALREQDPDNNEETGRRFR